MIPAELIQVFGVECVSMGIARETMLLLDTAVKSHPICLLDFNKIETEKITV
jgi:hypothetical protein